MLDLGMLGVLLLATIIIQTVQAIHNVYFHPLSKFPGPISRAASIWPVTWEAWAGTSIRNIDALHKKYGSVVRTAPNALSYSSAQAWKDIYGFKQTRQQIPKDIRRAPPVNGVLPILFANDTDHSRMRKLMSHAFSEAAVKEQMPLVASHMQQLIHQLQTQGFEAENKAVDINEWINYLTFDVVTDLSFGEPLGSLRKGKADPLITGFFAACKMFPVIPMTNDFTLANWLWQLTMMIPAVKRDREMGFLATKDRVDRRMIHERTDAKDFMTYIMRYNDEKGMTKEEIYGSTTVFVNAGGEATAACICGAIYLMLQNPETYAKAKQEVRDSFESQKAIESSPCNHLPYLNAVVDETMRAYPPSPGDFTRRTAVDTEIDGEVVPPNVSVGVHQWAANHSEANFFQPAQFVPERWLKDAPPQFHGDVRAARQPWAIGPRNCLGKNVAYLEIRMALCLLLFVFDMELLPGNEGWIERQTYNIIWNRLPLHVRLLLRQF